MPTTPPLWTYYDDLGADLDAPTPPPLAATLRLAIRGWGCDEDALLDLLRAAPRRARLALPQDTDLWNQLLTITTPTALAAALEAP